MLYHKVMLFSLPVNCYLIYFYLSRRQRVKCLINNNLTSAKRYVYDINVTNILSVRAIGLVTVTPTGRPRDQADSQLTTQLQPMRRRRPRLSEAWQPVQTRLFHQYNIRQSDTNVNCFFRFICVACR